MMVSKAYMTFQKFLSDNATLKVDVIPDDKKNDIKQIIDSHMNKLSDEEQKSNEEISNLKG